MNFHEIISNVSVTLKDFNIKRVEVTETYLIVEVDLSSIFRKLEDPVRLFFSSYSYVEEQLSLDEDWLDLIYANFKGISDLFIIFLDSVPARNRIRERVVSSSNSYIKGQPIIPLDKLFKRGSISNTLKDLILSNTEYVGLLCPYQTDESTPNKMFFGRKSELEKIHRSTENVFLYGARRMGKSSLALQLKKSYGVLPIESTLGLKSAGLDLRAKGRHLNRCSYVDLSSYGTNASNYLWTKIIEGFNLSSHSLFKALGRKIKPGIVFSSKLGQGYVIDEFLALENFLTEFSRNTVIILDEVDTWIKEESSRGWETINRLRGLTDEGKAKVILIGYEHLMIALQNKSFPFWQRGMPYCLTPLKKEDIRDLVLKPMLELNIEVEPETQIIDRIWQTTSGLPHLVQDICRHAVELCIHDKTFQLNNPKLNDAINTSDSLKKFRNGFFSDNFPLAKAITGVISFNTYKDEIDLMSDETPPKEEYSMTIKDIINYLKKSDFQYESEVFEFALYHLELMSIIRPLNSRRTTWSWVNLIASKEAARAISEVGFDDWRKDVLNKHNEGEWRNTFKSLGVLI